MTSVSASPVTALTGKAELVGLTGLRGCAATMVMLYHFSLSLPAHTLPFQDGLQRGYLFVDLFFVLSGFVMAYSQTRLFAGGYSPRAHVTYLAARLARIYPLYVAITLESAFLAAWRTADADWTGLLSVLGLNLALVQAWGLAPSLEGAAWSISTEWGAYLLFPLLLAAAVLGSARVAAVTGGLAVLAIAGLAAWTGTVTLAGQERVGPLDYYSSATALPLLRCVAEFALGLVTFRITRDRMDAFRGSAGVLAWAALAGLAVALWGVASDVAVVLLFALLIMALSYQTGAVARALGAAVPYRLGVWSYSIYLIHDKFSHPAASLREWLAPRVPMASLVTVVLMSAAVIATGAATHMIVELPLRKLALRRLRGHSAGEAETPMIGAVRG